MFRFTIRDVMWLTALMAMGAGWGVSSCHQSEQIRTLEESRLEVMMSADEIASTIGANALAFKNAQAKALDAERKYHDLKFRIEHPEAVRDSTALRAASEAEIEAAKRRSAELGAPQPKPLPPGYGEAPNTR